MSLTLKRVPFGRGMTSVTDIRHCGRHLSPVCFNVAVT
jgi:hypothetical protein